MGASKHFWGFGALLWGCAAQPGVLVDIGSWPDGATTLQVGGTLDGSASDARLSFPGGTTRFVVYLPAGRSGRLELDVAALDDRECVHAQTKAQVDLGGGLRSISELDITLAQINPPQCPAPLLQEVAPAVGPTAGDTIISLSGQHFLAGATVTIDGIPAPASQWMSSTQIRATLPAHPGAFGPVPIIVRNPDGQEASRPDLFSYYASQLNFSRMTPFPTYKLPAAVIAADMNGDNAMDLVTANGQGSVSLLIGNGQGSFDSPKLLATTANSASLAAGDFNRDKKTDLAVVSFGSNSVYILLGDGQGGLLATSDLPGIGNPGKLVASDVNQDGSLDLVVTSGFSNSVNVLLGNSKGGFGMPAAFPTGLSPVAVAVADLNRDQFPDIVVANTGSGGISVLLGDGRGSFGAATHYPTGNFPIAIGIGDLNGDSKPDLAIAHLADESVSVLLGDGNGTFNLKDKFGTGRVPYTLLLCDIDGDRNLDLVIAANGENSAHILLGDGAGGFGTASILPTGTDPRAVVCADLNHDGRPDIATANYSGDGVSVFLNQSQ